MALDLEHELANDLVGVFNFLVEKLSNCSICLGDS